MRGSLSYKCLHTVSIVLNHDRPSGLYWHDRIVTFFNIPTLRMITMTKDVGWCLTLWLLMMAQTIHAGEPPRHVVCKCRALSKEAPTSLDGIWLIQSVHIGKRNLISEGWFSTITIRASTFRMSRFRGSTKDLTGTFTLNRGVSTQSIDLNTDEIDLSDLWEGVKYSTWRWALIYRYDGDSLAIRLHIGSDSQRPRDFVTNESDHDLTLSLVRAPAGFKGFPKDVLVTAADLNGRVVSGASVFGFMSLREESKTPNEWKYEQITRTGADGSAEYLMMAWRDVQLLYRDANRRLIGFASASPYSCIDGPVHVTLLPECRIHGKITCTELAKQDKAIGWTNAYLLFDGQRIGMCAKKNSVSSNFKYRRGNTLSTFTGKSFTGKTLIW